MKVQYSKEEVKELFEKYQAVQIDFNLENIKSVTSGLNATLFNKYNLKFEIIYFNKKFSYQHDDIDYITMQIYNKLFQYLDTVSVIPYMDLLAIMKQRTNEFDNLIMLLLPATYNDYNDTHLVNYNIDTLQNYVFVVFDKGGVVVD